MVAISGGLCSSGLIFLFKFVPPFWITMKLKTFVSKVSFFLTVRAFYWVLSSPRRDGGPERGLFGPPRRGWSVVVLPWPPVLFLVSPCPKLTPTEGSEGVILSNLFSDSELRSSPYAASAVGRGSRLSKSLLVVANLSSTAIKSWYNRCSCMYCVNFWISLGHSMGLGVLLSMVLHKLCSWF